MSAAAARPLGSTYRLELRGIGFRGAHALVGYLSALGIETLYVSPVFAAGPGSTHGYDVIDPTRLDPALGTREDFDALLGALEDHQMRLVLDIVPNHMAAETANGWWCDVLRLGLGSPVAAFFDIDWSTQGGRVLLAALDAPLDAVLGRRGVRVDLDRLVVEVGDVRFPIDPATVGPGRADGPDEVLGRQHYRLAYWRLGRFEGNYRRFFDVDGLVGLRVEDPAVYEATQRFVLDLARDPRVAGLRVDHIDGLADPAGYLERLRRDLAAHRRSAPSVIVEKILGVDEWLPSDWDVDGTTGYEFADLATRLFVDPAGAARFEGLGAQVTGEHRTFDDLARAARAEVLDMLFPGQLDRLASVARAAIDTRASGSDLSLPDLRRALRALAAHLYVYRTYLSSTAAHRADRTRLEHAASAARRALDGDGCRALDAVVRTLLAADTRGSGDAAAVAEARTELVVRWQQLSGAVAAKGVEDTACYRYDGLLASAEVGANPGRPTLAIDDLHRELALRARRAPGGLNALSTHDTKRSADVRARLAALSEVADEWARLVRRWRRRFGPAIEAGGGPDPHDELFFYQSLFGIWPLGAGEAGTTLRARLQDAMRKAARESKRATSWLDPNETYEGALGSFIDAVLDDGPTANEIDRLLRRVGPAAATNSLAMTVLAAVAPGVPDLYQGSELWDFSLMDPDNRRPVDFDARAHALSILAGPARQRAGEARALLESWEDGRVKLAVTAAVLDLRRREPALFASGSYVPLATRGRHRDHVVAFGRRRGRRWVIAVVPRHTMTVAGPGRVASGRGSWAGTTILLPDRAPASFVDVLSGTVLSAPNGSLSVGRALDTLPVAVLVDGRAWGPTGA